MKVGFIGFGHMAGAMYKGLISSGYIEPNEACACASDYEKLLERSPGLHVFRSPEDVAQEAGIIIVAVKPGQVEDVMYPIKDRLGGCIVISVAFGIDFDEYERIFAGLRKDEIAPGMEIPKSKIKHISIIPNTPCEVGEGITICEDKHNLSDPELEIVKALLKKLGRIEFISTDKMWLAGEMTSCGPAFAAMFIEALGDAGAKYGIEKETAYRIVSQMVSGTGKLQVETRKNPGKMVTEVATPGGVTIKGVTALREAGFHDVVGLAIDAIEKSK